MVSHYDMVLRRVNYHEGDSFFMQQTGEQVDESTMHGIPKCVVRYFALADGSMGWI